MFIKRPLLLFLMAFVILFLSSDFLQAQTRTASGTVTSYSLNLYNISGYHSSGGFYFYVYFSTYDGIANAFPQGLGYNESGELSPTTLGGARYVSDYAIYSSGYYYNRGYMVLNIPLTDSDGNGFPDLLQVDKTVNSTISFSLNEYETSNYGSTYSWYGTETGSIRLSRSAGNYQGTATGTINSSTFSGSFQAEGGFGNAVYDLSARSIRFEGTSFGLGTTGSGTSTFTRINDNQVNVAAFYFYTSDGYRRTVYGFTLNRSGKYYRGDVALADGDPGTSYVDYKDCFIEIYDSNDSDSDGIPDLSDASTSYSFSSSPGATANGDEWSAAYDAAKAFDGSNSTTYHSKAGNTYPHVLAYDCGSARSVSSISLNQGWHPATSVQVLGSNDNASWTDLGTFSTSAGLNTLSLSSPQSFRYWAIRALAGNSVYWCVYEIGLNGGYSFSSSPGATANGDEWSAAYDAAKAFDGSNSTAYHSKAGNTYPHVLAYDCGSARSVSSISLNQGWHPATSVQVLGSNDNASWTDLGTFSTSAGLNTLSLSSPQSFRYWAIRALAGNSVYWCVYEIGL